MMTEEQVHDRTRKGESLWAVVNGHVVSVTPLVFHSPMPSHNYWSCVIHGIGRRRLTAEHLHGTAASAWLAKIANSIDVSAVVEPFDGASLRKMIAFDLQWDQVWIEVTTTNGHDELNDVLLFYRTGYGDLDYGAMRMTAVPAEISDMLHGAGLRVVDHLAVEDATDGGN